MFSFRSLASGSSGNAYLLRSGSAAILIDAGLSPKRLANYLRSEDLAPEHISAVILSHEHHDHCIAAPDLAVKYNVPVWANLEVLRATGLHSAPCARILPVGSPVVVGGVEITAFPVRHDAVNPVGFTLRAHNRTVTIATDLGTVDDTVCEAVARADLVVIEANHDLDMLHRGRYPYHLRARVSGPLGHLSNVQAARMLAHSLRGEQVEVWLAHLSRENNSASLASRTVRGVLHASGLGNVPIAIAQRDKPSLRWDGLPKPRQLSLFSAEAASA